MKKSTAKLTALTLAAMMALAGCGSSGGSTSGSGESASSDQLTDLYTWETQAHEVETLNVLNSQNAADSNVITNLVEGLLSTDSEGQLIPALAEDYSTDDNGLTWTFKLREGVKWVDKNGEEKADCTAQDFLTGLEFVMNYHKNASTNISMPQEMITGADEYYEYTKTLSEEEGRALTADEGSKFLEMVGIEAPDDYTVVYHCTSELPYFPTVATYNCLYPASQALIDELGIDGFLACDDTTMWFNGAYLLTSYTPNNEKVLTKNEAYWDTESQRFDTVTIKMIESLDTGFQLYQAGELDRIDLSESNLTTIYNDENNEYHDQLVEKRPDKFSYQFHFNYSKMNEDGTPDDNWNKAIANTAFRQAMYYGLDLTSYYARTNAINPLKCENNFYTMKGLVYTSDGRDYTDLVAEKLGLGESDGETMIRLDADKASELKAQAMEELAAEGVTFPVEIDYYVPANNQTSIDSATVLKQAFSDSLGDDFVTLNIKTYVNNLTAEVVDPQLQSFVVNGWGADYGDPQNFLGQETYGEDGAYYSMHYSNINDATDEELISLYQQFTDLVNTAKAITDDTDARYEAYAEAEAFMIENVLVMPCNYNIAWQLTHVNDYTTKNAAFGIQNYKYVGWETSVDAYTTEQYDEFASGSGNGASAAE